MSSIQEKYEQLVAENPGAEIWIHRGLPNKQGGWFVAPRMDPDEGKRIPLIRPFHIARGRAGDARRGLMRQDGWEPFTPPAPPSGIRRVEPEAQAEQPAPRSAPSRNPRPKRK